MDLPGIEQYWLDDICSAMMGVSRLAIILANNL
jgi:hypothetical protein